MSIIAINQSLVPVQPRCRRHRPRRPKAQFRQTMQSPVLANGFTTVFPLPTTDIYGKPIRFVIGESYGSGGTGGGLSPSFDLVGTTPSNPANTFVVTGVPGVLTATFSSAPTVITGSTTSVVTFDISTPLY